MLLKSVEALEAKNLTHGDNTGSSLDHPNPIPEVSPVTAHSTRRELRSVRPAFSPSVELRPSVPVATAPGAAAKSAVAKKRKRKANVLNVVVMTFVSGLVGVLALPAYAFGPAEASAQASASLQDIRTDNAQVLAVSGAAAPTITRDTFTATSLAEIQAAEAAAARAAAEAAQAAAAAARRAQIAETYGPYAGPTARDFVAAPAYPSFSLDQVAAVARQYEGVPYRLGGATPAGFDCSGLIMFVYAQFGVSLPHGVRGQAASGTRISPADAVPGDLVIWNDYSHNGIYLGGGNFIDAPRPGKNVMVRPIWSDAVYFVRIGI